MSTSAYAQVSRFHGFATIALPGKGETVYLTPEDARRIGAALIECADSVEREPRYTISTFSTVEFQLSNGGSRYAKGARP